MKSSLAMGHSFAAGAPGMLGLASQASVSSQIARTLQQLHLDTEQVEACVDEIYPRFMQAINYAHFEREACFVYALQSMFAVTALTHGAIEDGVDRDMSRSAFKTEKERVESRMRKLDESVSVELLRVGFIDQSDDDAAKCFKRMMFSDAWEAVMADGYCRISSAFKSSVDRVLKEHLGESSSFGTSGAIN